ncbi:SRPBCC family protein, partial [Micromonospora zhanjiangensis]
MNETLETVDGRPTLRVERRFDHPPTKVWRAVTEPDHLARWFPFTVRLEPANGGTIRFYPPDRPDVPASEGTVTAYEPPRLFAFTWGDDLLRFELHPAGTGCLLVFTHTFDDRAGAASFAAGWRVCLDALTGDLASA